MAACNARKSWHAWCGVKSNCNGGETGEERTRGERREKNVSYVETGLVILSSLPLPLVRVYNSNLKALKLIRSFFIAEGSRLSLHFYYWVHRLLLSGIDPFLRLPGGNYSEIFAFQSGELYLTFLLNQLSAVLRFQASVRVTVCRLLTIYSSSMNRRGV